MRAVLAVALFAGFYVLGLAIAFGLLWLPYAEWRYADHITLRLLVFAVVGAGIILWSLVPRIDRFEVPGPELVASDQPRLFQLIREVASATEQQMPSHVYLVPAVNAWVAQRGGVMGFGSQRVMGLGLPLLSRLSVSQFAAVLAHEFGHYHGGDTSLGPWIYKTRAAIGRTLGNLSRHSSALTKIFEWYGAMFLRVTHAISRAQEFGADALAARIAGREPLVEGLKQVHAHGLTFAGFWEQEFVPVLQSGFRPSLREGFEQFVSSAVITEAVAKVVANELTESKSDTYDTHPPLRDRIAALEDNAESPRWVEGSPAISLLDDPQGVEDELIVWMVGPEGLQKLSPARWEDIAGLVWVPAWKKLVSEHIHRFKNFKPAGLADLSPQPGVLAVALQLAARPQAASDQHVQFASTLLGAALATVLVSHGWTLEAGPGQPVVLRSGNYSVEPFVLWPKLVSGEISAAEWKNLCVETGIADLDLGERLAA